MLADIFEALSELIILTASRCLHGIILIIICIVLLLLLAVVLEGQPDALEK